MSITAASLYQRTRRYLRDFKNRDSLTAALSDTTSTTVTVADSGLYQPRWPIEVDQETMVVRTILTATTIAVERGAFGSTAATHANGSIVLINPAFYGVEILDALSEGIQAAYPLIYKPVVDTSLIIQANVWEYAIPNMPGTYNSDSVPIPAVSSIELQEPGVVPYFPTSSYAVIRGAVPTIKFFNLETPGARVRIRGFGSFPDLADFTSTLDALWPKQANYLPPLYAAASLLMSGEAGRVRVTSGAVDAREQANRTGASLQIGGALMNRFQNELRSSSMGPMPKHVRTRI